MNEGVRAEMDRGRLSIQQRLQDEPGIKVFEGEREGKKILVVSADNLLNPFDDQIIQKIFDTYTKYSVANYSTQSIAVSCLMASAYVNEQMGGHQILRSGNVRGLNNHAIAFKEGEGMVYGADIYARYFDYSSNTSSRYDVVIVCAKNREDLVALCNKALTGSWEIVDISEGLN